jgi:transposase
MWREFRGALSFGNARLQWDKPPGRKGRWMLSMAVTSPARVRTERPLICAVRLGMLTTCTLAYADPEAGKVQRFGDSVDLPASTWRTVRRVEKELTERGRWNRKDRGQREGRGRVRKLRATASIGDVVSRVTDTAIRQTAAAVVATAIRRGATALVLPDLAHWSVASELDRTEDLPEGDRSAHRKWYFRVHQGALRQMIGEAAEREGLAVSEVNVSGSSHTCSECGVANEAGRVGRLWSCSCGCKLPVETNPARVLAGRALSR